MSSLVEMIGLVTGGASGGSLLGIIATKWFDRGKTEGEGAVLDAEAAKIIAATAVSLVAPLERQVESLSKRVAILESENATTTGKLRRSINYIRTLLTWIAEKVPGENPPNPPADLLFIT